MNFLLAPLFGILGALGRRWFGGWSLNVDEKKHPILYKIVDCRAIQTVFLIGLFFLCFFINDSWALTPISSFIIGLGLPLWIMALIIAVIFHGLFYATPHGPAFDSGRSQNTDEKMIERYKKEWWNKICEKLIPEPYWYGFLYDFMWMLLRYSIAPIVLLPFVWNPTILVLGIIASGLYAFVWTLYERDNWLFKKLESDFIDGATSLAEIILGFITIIVLMIL